MAKQEFFMVPLLRESVLMPHADGVVNLSSALVRPLHAHIKKDDWVVLVAQKGEVYEGQKLGSLHDVGTLCQVTNVTSGALFQLSVRCVKRFFCEKIFENDGLFKCDGREMTTDEGDVLPRQAAYLMLIKEIDQYQKVVLGKSSGTLQSIAQIQDPQEMADRLASQLENLTGSERQKLLEEKHLVKRIEMLIEHIKTQVCIIMEQRKLRKALIERVNKNQQEYLARMRADVLREEDENGEWQQLETRIKRSKMSADVRAIADNELRKLKGMNSMSSEAVVTRNYLEWLCDMPWGVRNKLQTDLRVARDILDQDHFGLDKPKKEIIKYLASYNRSKAARGTVICFVGPPGVGKTSLGESIARATKRKFQRIPLGGVKDEAEIRGHRRTYVGANPGKILQALKACKTRNPLLLLDEVDKIGQDWRGDPAAALLEVLDPKQNHGFKDHFLEVPFPLDECMFVCTANSLDTIPPALLDRMEVLELASYTQEEKLSIARTHLLPKQCERNGVKADKVQMDDEAFVRLIREYTMEAGVRELDRRLGFIVREVGLLMDDDRVQQVHITADNLPEYAGRPVRTPIKPCLQPAVGLVRGLSWSEVGGRVLSVESVLVPGRGKVSATGRLGTVMGESVNAAFAFLSAQIGQKKVDGLLTSDKDLMDWECLTRHDMRVHVPEGATPKEGPSAGVAFFISMLSAVWGQPVRGDVAVTGEISIRGDVLPVGGIKEKLMAAHRAQVTTVLIPEENKRDLEELPESVRQALTVIPVAHARQAIAVMFESSASQSSLEGADLALGGDLG